MTLDTLEPEDDPEQARLARHLLAAALVLGLALDVWLGSRLALQGLEARHLAARTVSLEAEQAALEPQIAHRRELGKRRDVLRRTEDQLHAIAGSRQLWSPKLARLGAIYEGSPGDWVDRIELARRPSGGSALTIDFRTRGNDLGSVAPFREKLTSDPVFFTGFDRLEASRVTVRRKSLAADEDAPFMLFTGTFVRGGP